MIAAGRVTTRDGRPVTRDERPSADELAVDGEPLDPPAPLSLMLHKPTGFTCSREDAGRLVYELLPPRFLKRQPALGIAGRLDKETTGLTLLTDDGTLLHRIISPRKQVWKKYRAVLARPLAGHEAALFASGTLLLEGEKTPCAPARLEPLAPTEARIWLTEGRYHQVRRMFAAAGNHVEALHREAIGGLELGSLAPAHWRVLDAADLERLFGG